MHRDTRPYTDRIIRPENSIVRDNETGTNNVGNITFTDEIEDYTFVKYLNGSTKRNMSIVDQHIGLCKSQLILLTNHINQAVRMPSTLARLSVQFIA